MKSFLSDFIGSLTTKTSTSVYKVLEESRVDKAQLSRLAEKLSSVYVNPGVALQKPALFSFIGSSPVRSNVQEISIAMQELYSISNEVSVLLSSHNDLLHSEIKRLEDELTALDKAIDNYAFLLSDAQAYDSAYLESFSDTLGQAVAEWDLTDRASQIFTQDDIAIVNPVASNITIFGRLRNSYPITASISSDNHQAFIKSETPLSNIVDDSSAKGWRRSIMSPRPLNSTLREFNGIHGVSNYTGAQVVVDIVLGQPSPCDTIRITPFADGDVAITQIQIFPSVNSNEHVNLLTEEKIIDKSLPVYFPFQTIAKVKLFIRQPTYRRNIAEAIESEEDYRYLSSHFLSVLNSEKSQNLTYNQLYRIGVLMREFAEIARSPQSVTVPRGGFDTDPSKPNINDLFKKLRDYDIRPIIRDGDITGAHLMDILTTFGLRDDNGFFGIRGNTNRPRDISRRYNFSQLSKDYIVNPIYIQNSAPTSNISQMPSIEKSNPLSVQMKYQYVLGLKSVAIGSSARGHKACYISEIIPSSGDAGEVKIKVSEENYYESDTLKDNPYLTSVEYSVTNASVPSSESDWVPILPSDETTVTNERLFPDSRGKCFFRFPASANDDVIFYKNGAIVDIKSQDAYVFGADQRTIVGLNIPTALYTSGDFLTCAYTPASDPTVVNFESYGFTKPPLVSSFDASGSGELYSNTGGDLVLSLKHRPFVDYTQVNTSSYSETNGLAPYTPIVVKLSGGIIANNLTNYKGGFQSPLDAGSEDYQFIHVDNTLMFNKPIVEPFRVFYQYLPSNLRFRVILRCNNSELVTPKVDFVQIKSKTRKADAKRDM